jgi:hypothetical protein
VTAVVMAVEDWRSDGGGYGGDGGSSAARGSDTRAARDRDRGVSAARHISER